MHPSSFPIDRVPPQARAAIRSIEDQTQAPVGLVASSVFAALSLATQAAYDIQRNDNLTSPVALSFLIIAASGERKTTVDNISMKPFIDFQNEPSCTCRFIYSDITPTAFFSKLHACSRSAALIENEAGRIFEGRLMEDIGLLNKLWDGKSMSVDRHKSSISIDEPRCTNCLLIQPQIFRAAMRKSGGRLSDYGFLARCLICEPPTNQGRRFIDENSKPDKNGYDNFYSKIQKLLTEQADYFSPGSERLKTPRQVIRFDHYAQKAWISIYNYIERNTASDGIYRYHPEYASKMAENIARLAGIFHIFEGSSEENIPESTLLSARDIIFWYADEYMRLFSDDSSFDQIVEDAGKLEKFLIKTFSEKNLSYYRKSDLLYYGPNSLRKAVRLDAAIHYLSQQGVIVIYQEPKYTAAQRISKTAYIALTRVMQPAFMDMQQDFIKKSLVCTTHTFNSISEV